MDRTLNVRFWPVADIAPGRSRRGGDNVCLRSFGDVPEVCFPVRTPGFDCRRGGFETSSSGQFLGATQWR